MGFLTNCRCGLWAVLVVGLGLPGAGCVASAENRKAEGAALFAEKGCAHCHGAAGFGGSDSGPDLSHVGKELKAAEMAQQIHDGGNNMPPFGDALTDEQIQSLVAYLRSKRKAPVGYGRQTVAAAPVSKSVGHRDPE